MTECEICTLKYNNSTRKAVECTSCHKKMCRDCTKKYLLETIKDPHCMHCNTGWTIEFLYETLTKTFITKDLKVHRQNVLLQREKAFLPEAQELAERLKRQKTRLTLQGEVRKQRLVLEKDRGDLVIARRAVEELKPIDEVKLATFQDAIVKINEELAALARRLNEPEEGEGIPQEVDNEPNKKIKRLRKCPGENCRGFLDEEWNCGLCNRKACKHCNTIVVGENHQCRPEDVENAKALLQNTKPCPNCGSPIFKDGGCNQMFCTSCHTAFDWNTNRIVTTAIHNPHYFEWRQRTGRDIRPEEALPCGGLPQYIEGGIFGTDDDYEVARQMIHQLNRRRRREHELQTRQWARLQKHRETMLLAGEEVDYDLPPPPGELVLETMPEREPANGVNPEKYNRALRCILEIRALNMEPEDHQRMRRYLRARYLIGEIDEAKWKKELTDLERKEYREQTFFAINQMVVMAATDVFQRLMQCKGEDDAEKCYQELKDICSRHNYHLVDRKKRLFAIFFLSKSVSSFFHLASSISPMEYRALKYLLIL